MASEIERAISGFVAVQYPSWDILPSSLNERIKPNSCLRQYARKKASTNVVTASDVLSCLK
ncbi:hypothetical protein [Candidatus Scalindua japonica]|uniref:hypothetical protein n=1 Tax=Candidatus Scalindua japonica TaxID=1284222 RepID=UPI0010560C70|nr:hypothetical protein [Candidatus Scalindua japonica]